MVRATLIAATSSLVLAGCVGTQDAVDPTFFGNWITEVSQDPETGQFLMFMTLFPEPGFDQQILWLGLVCDDVELEVGFGLADPYPPTDPLAITTQIEDGPVVDRQGDFFGEGEVIGFASNAVALAFVDEMAAGTALTVTADSDGDVRGPALFDITGADAIARRVRDDCL